MFYLSVVWAVKSERPSGDEDVDTRSWEQVLLVHVGMKPLLSFSGSNYLPSATDWQWKEGKAVLEADLILDYYGTGSVYA